MNPNQTTTAADVDLMAQNPPPPGIDPVLWMEHLRTAHDRRTVETAAALARINVGGPLPPPAPGDLLLMIAKSRQAQQGNNHYGLTNSQTFNRGGIL